MVDAAKTVKPAKTTKAVKTTKVTRTAKKTAAAAPLVKTSAPAISIVANAVKTTRSAKAADVVTPVAALAKTDALAINIGISDSDRAAICTELSKLLADSWTLYLMTHNFHWNVTGALFNTLHEMFMTQYSETWTALDSIAERIRALGHPAPGTYRDYVKLASIEEPIGVPAATDMLRLLVQGNEAVAKTARAAFIIADAANDQPTADLLTQRMDIHEKNAWMLRSLLQ